MPHYFFDTDNGETFVKGSRPYNLKGLEAARRFAQDALADMTRDATPGGGDRRTMTVTVRDEAGAVVLRALLTLVIEVGPFRDG